MGLFGSILGGIGKAIFGGSHKDSRTKQSGTSDFDPWDVAIPYLTDYLKSTKALYGGGAPMFSPEELQGYDLLKQVVNSGGQALNPAIAENNKVLSGAYLNPETNPYLLDIAKRSAGLAGMSSNSAFSGAGRTGSGLAGYYAGKGAADASNELFYRNYGDERGRMGSAVSVAPALEAGRYLGPQALISAGQNISARPYDINSQYGDIISKIAGLGQQGKTTGTSTNYSYDGGLIGKIWNSFTNKLFPGG